MPAQGGYGRIRLFHDFQGPEIPVANAVAYGTSAGGCNYYIGDFSLKGDLAQTDAGLVSLSKASGYGRLGGDNQDGKGAAICTEICFSPVLNGPMAVECRLERAALTAGVTFVGFCGTAADDIAEPVTSTGTTHTLVATDLCGFLLDSQLTASDGLWHTVYAGGATTGPTLSTTNETTKTAILAESDIVRLEIDPNGTARFYINGDLERTVEGAVSTTALQAALVGIWGTTTTAASVDLDYFAVEANRDWTR